MMRNFSQKTVSTIPTVPRWLLILLLVPTLTIARQQNRQTPSVRLKSASANAIEFTDIRIAAPDSLQNLRSVREIRRAQSPRALQSRLRDLMKELGESGYAFAKIQLDSIAMTTTGSDTSYSLVVRVVPGKPVYVRGVRIAGNSVTREQTIRRELPVKIGSLFRESVIEEISVSLRRMGIFRRVPRPQLLLDANGNGVLSITVEEGQSNTFNGVIGYNPPVAAQPGFVSGLVDVKFGNLFGTGRQLAARWQKRARDTQDLALRYREPWLLGLPLHLEGGFQQQLRDTLYVDRTFDLSAELPILPRMALIGRVESSQITPDSLAIGLIPKSRALSAGLGLRYDSSDDPINPTSGAFYSTILESIDKSITIQNGASEAAFDTRQKRLLVDAGWYQPLWSAQVISLALHWRQISSADSLNPLTDVFRFGGATTLRGYREEQFSGSRIAWANVEARYLLSRWSRVFVFYDHGYFFRETASGRVENDKRSFGLGARLETRLGIIGFDYGLGEGDGLLEGKVHLTLVSRF